MSPSLADLLFVTPFGIGAAAAALSDMRHRRVTNGLNGAILIAGLALRATEGGMPLLSGLGGAALGLLLLLPLFAARWVGGGDAKFLMAAGAWLGPQGIFWATLFGLVGGGLMAAALAVRGGPAMRAEVMANMTAAFYTRSAPASPDRPSAQQVPLVLPLALAAVGVLIVLGGPHA